MKNVESRVSFDIFSKIDWFEAHFLFNEFHGAHKTQGQLMGNHFFGPKMVLMGVLEVDGHN